MKKAFTLMEINLAILVMAGGILSVVSLYSLGFRESRQSSEDVASAAYAEAVISPLVMAISSTNLAWSVFKDALYLPSAEGWGAFLDEDTGQVENVPDASGTFKSVMDKMSQAASKTGGSLQAPSWPASADGGLVGGLVVLHDAGSTIYRIGFRAAKQKNMLMSAPLYYTEVRFQGVSDK
ncbi:MAG: hypothetical protein J6W80_05165 [Kiritimatiellae bacterium]|nr:hypothetical protein [Kiritimatiellia bacterium]